MTGVQTCALPISPAPDWVIPVTDAPQATAGAALHDRLLDQQVRLGPQGSSRYTNVIRVVDNPAGMAPAMAQADFIAPNALNTMGGQIQTQNQNDINNLSQAWQNEWNYPVQQQDILANGIAGAMGTATRTSTQQNPYFTNPLGNALGLGMGAMQLYGAGKNAGLWGVAQPSYNYSSGGTGYTGDMVYDSGNLVPMSSIWG